MKIFKDKHALQKEILKTRGISFIPTMGGLHKGHISLIKQSKKSKLKTLVSIYVNPKQFNKKRDFISYPRNVKKDIKQLKKLKIHYLYTPTFKDIYGFNPKKKVYLDKINFVKDRPGHDTRYALNSNKIKKELNWYPKTKFIDGIRLTLNWYKNNKTYFNSISKKDITKRLGKNDK